MRSCDPGNFFALLPPTCHTKPFIHIHTLVTEANVQGATCSPVMGHSVTAGCRLPKQSLYNRKVGYIDFRFSEDGAIVLELILELISHNWCGKSWPNRGQPCSPVVGSNQSQLVLQRKQTHQQPAPPWQLTGLSLVIGAWCSAQCKPASEPVFTVLSQGHSFLLLGDWLKGWDTLHHFLPLELQLYLPTSQAETRAAHTLDRFNCNYWWEGSAAMP